jgi:hypothetical protein
MIGASVYPVAAEDFLFSMACVCAFACLTLAMAASAFGGRK